jgi:hypothetical protein
MSALDDMGAAIERAFEKEPAHEVLNVLTGALVCLVVGLAQRHGHSVDCAIKLHGGQKRDITIHAPKGDNHD